MLRVLKDLMDLEFVYIAVLLVIFMVYKVDMNGT